MRRKVLFVDDEINILKSIRRELLDEQFDVLLANSGKEALDILSGETVDMIISDVKMPVMDGIEFLAIAKEKYPAVPRIFLSGYVEQATVVSALVKGIATAYFAKPWQPDTLKKIIYHNFEINENLHRLELQILIGKIDNLPSLPAVYQEFLSALSNEKTVKELVQILEKDISLSISLLQVANSAFYGRMPISSLERAIINLGNSVVKDIVLNLSLTSQMRWDPFQKHELEFIFTHSSQVNSLIHSIYQKKANTSLNKELSSVGITHDIGKIILLQYFPDRYKNIINTIHQNNEMDFYQAELSLGFIGQTHAEIGAFFLDNWNLPHINVEVSMFHHCPKNSSPDNLLLVETVSIADQMVNSLFYSGSVASGLELLKKENLESDKIVTIFQGLSTLKT
jgi:HD-like signal output (HDOD) protein